MTKSNDDIPADELTAADRIASLHGEGDVTEIEVDAYDYEGSLHLELCFPACGDLQAFADGELEGDDAEAFRDHLPGCDRCSNALLENMQLSVQLEDAAPTLDGIDQGEPVHEDVEPGPSIGNVPDPDEELTQPMEPCEVDGKFDASEDDNILPDEESK